MGGGAIGEMENLLYLGGGVTGGTRIGHGEGGRDAIGGEEEIAGIAFEPGVKIGAEGVVGGGSRSGFGGGDLAEEEGCGDEEEGGLFHGILVSRMRVGVEGGC